MGGQFLLCDDRRNNLSYRHYRFKLSRIRLTFTLEFLDYEVFVFVIGPLFYWMSRKI